ncbi:5'-adenylylsulfate reductase-like 7 [Tripterygium wilfordii]|uniref:5'-adenylylsulfate reductase-like 7 n=1 Tax=Tripterygium wilfordii TaxID=458696 RepID=A0A7J7DRY8_TRIWF|nr:5'-adenylylsulfate reductase-like 5 [Tripterygium wilfordii]KAF5749172.1 5'-adenylylsulfate reductase-like 7 [Tripterygium wilfordii]
MASFSARYLLFLCIAALLSLSFASGSPSTCLRESCWFIYDLQSQCPRSISLNPPVEVDGNYLDRALTSKQRNAYASLLFYSSWCPFSRQMRLKFEKLSSMFPRIEHLEVEESSSLPSIFSRYGIHSLPAIILVNQTSKIQYRGSKNLLSLVQFYERTTGLKTVQYFTEDEPASFGDDEQFIMQPWISSSLGDMIKREPYLVLATLFIFLRVLLYIFPKVASLLKAFRIRIYYALLSYVLHLEFGIFGDETSQLFGRVLHMIDVRRIWTKLRLCKIRNFHQGAKNARVWASSLASVSLGESSSIRSSS